MSLIYAILTNKIYSIDALDACEDKKTQEPYDTIDADMLGFKIQRTLVESRLPRSCQDC